MLVAKFSVQSRRVDSGVYTLLNAVIPILIEQPADISCKVVFSKLGMLLFFHLGSGGRILFALL